MQADSKKHQIDKWPFYVLAVILAGIAIAATYSKTEELEFTILDTYKAMFVFDEGNVFNTQGVRFNCTFNHPDMSRGLEYKQDRLSFEGLDFFCSDSFKGLLVLRVKGAKSIQYLRFDFILGKVSEIKFSDSLLRRDGFEMVTEMDDKYSVVHLTRK